MAKAASSEKRCHSLMAGAGPEPYNGAVSLTLRIRELRQERGLTLAQLADKVGISTPHMSQVERGIKNVNNHLLERIAVALKVQPYQLLSEGPADRQTLLDLYERLSPEDQQRLEQFAHNLLISREPPRD
jgi:transcriptional regulator with XRE-family HTH domain